MNTARVVGLTQIWMLVLTVTLLVSNATADESPNIVFIISDDHAWTDYGFMGHPILETPSLDRLARRSAVFKRGYVPTALCRPALATLVTGKYAHQHQISGNDPWPLDSRETYAAMRERMIAKIDQQPLLPKLLADRGYQSFQSGKWWEGNYRRGGFTDGMTRGFPQPDGRHGDDGLKIGREGLKPIFDFVQQCSDDRKPFFLWYAPFMPHTPHTPPQALIDKYKNKGVTSDSIAKYFAMVEWFDQSCGELLEFLDKNQLSENTIIVYVGDNGWIQNPNDNGFAPRSKQSAYEGGVRQPTLFSWPGKIVPGDREAQLCSSVDIVPTALAAAGIDPPSEMPGYNLLPVLVSGAPTPRDAVYGESFSHDVYNLDNPEETLLYRWVIVDRWKLLLTYDGRLGRYAQHHPRDVTAPQLFDLISDPHERINLAEQRPDLVTALGEKLQNWWTVQHRVQPAPQ